MRGCSMVRFMIVVFARGDGIEIRTHRAGPRGKLSSSKDAVTGFLRTAMARRSAVGIFWSDKSSTQVSAPSNKFDYREGGTKRYIVVVSSSRQRLYSLLTIAASGNVVKTNVV